MIISIYLDDETVLRLRQAEQATCRPLEDLAECAVAESALAWARENGRLTDSSAKPSVLSKGAAVDGGGSVAASNAKGGEAGESDG